MYSCHAYGQISNTALPPITKLNIPFSQREQRRYCQEKMPFDKCELRFESKEISRG